jgi:hypothetical protein
MHLVLHLTPAAVTFTEPTSGGAYPLLLEVGTMRLGVRAGADSGLQVGETTNLAVTLDNSGRRAATIVGRPLRSAAEVYDDAGALFFAGLVSLVSYGRTVVLEIEA